MAGYEKRGEEEDFAEIVRKKFDKIRVKDSGKKDSNPKPSFSDSYTSAEDETFTTQAEEDTKLKNKPSFSDSYTSAEEEETSMDLGEETASKPDFLSQYVSSGQSFFVEQEEHPKTKSFFGEPPTTVKKFSPVKPQVPAFPFEASHSLRQLGSSAPPMPTAEPVLAAPVRDKMPRVILISSIIVFVLAVLVVAFVLIWMYTDSSGESRKLDTNEGLESAVVKNEETATIILSSDIDLNKLSGLSLVFSARDDSEYPYPPEYISSEYEINASEIGLENFNDVIVVRIFFDYKPSSDQSNETAEPSGNTASMGPFVRFWESVRGFFS